MSIESRYWAAKDLAECLPEADARVGRFYETLKSSRLFDLWRAVHWSLYAGQRTGGQLGSAGDQNELTTIEMGEFSNLYQHSLNLITAQRPQFECQATNTDHRSQSQTIVGNAVIDYAMRERDLEKTLEHAAGYMLKYAEGWVLKLWNALEGPDYRPDPETGRIVKAGDAEFHSLGPWDVARDTLAETAMNSAWHCPRLWVNRYDVMSRYPELEADIDSLSGKHEVEGERPRLASRQWTSTTGLEHNDEIPLYVWLHKKCDAIPDGRMIMYLSPEIALYDGPLAYRDTPLYRMSAMDVDGTTNGYSCLYDLLAPQQALNATVSTVVSNQAAFGVQNIWVPAGSNLNWKSLRGGLNMVEGGTQAPQAMNLLATKEETFRLFDLLRAAMERYSGINSTVRGNPEASLKSGAALALVYSQAIQFVALSQKAYVKSAERLGTAVIHDYQDFGQAERTVAIAGEASRPYSLMFSGSDIDQIDRATVRMSNPLTGTIAGRYNLGEMLLQNNLIDDPKQLIEVLTSGRVEPTYEAPVRERMNIRSENERLSKGEPVKAIFSDNPLLHIPEHLTVLASPEARENPAVVNAMQAHIQDHIQQWRTTDPDVLAACRIPPPPSAALPPPGAPPPGPPGAPPPRAPPPHGGQPPPHGRPGRMPPAPAPGMQGAPDVIQHKMPNLPGPARNPATGERFALATQGGQGVA